MEEKLKKINKIKEDFNFIKTTWIKIDSEINKDIVKRPELIYNQWIDWLRVENFNNQISYCLFNDKNTIFISNNEDLKNLKNIKDKRFLILIKKNLSL